MLLATCGLVVGVSPAGALSTALLAWSQLSSTTSPPARDVSVMAYDPATAQLVLFGGFAGTTLYNDTWVWNGSTWSQVDDSGDAGCTTSCTSSPPGRYGAAMAFDPATGQLLLFGGSVQGGNYYDDTWSWNGSSWSQVDDAGDAGCGNGSSPCSSSPSERQSPMIAYDAATQQLVLFGGVTGSTSTYLDDSWTWNGSSWAQTDDSADPGCTSACTASPPGRQAGALVYDPATAQLVLFGGAATSGLDDTWLWNGSSWSQVDDSGAPGCTSTCPSSPVGRDRAGADFDPAVGAMVLFGGLGANVYDDTWTWNGSTWTQIDDSGDAGCTTSCTSSPSARQVGAFAYDPASAQLLVFGGLSSANLNDTWDLVPPAPTSAGWAQVNTTAAPPARGVAVMAYDPATAQLVLFGGNTDAGAYNDTWVWSGTSWTQVDDSGDPGCTTSCTSSPSGRFAAAMAFDPATGQLLLFGGNGSSAWGNDTWGWNGSTWTQLDDSGSPGCHNNCPTSPAASQSPMIAYDPATAQMVFFGGSTGSVYENYTWTWNGSIWGQVDDSGDPGCTSSCTSSPPGRQAGVLAYDPASAQLVLFGGSAAAYDNDTWTWNGSNWTQVDDSGDPGCTASCTSSPPGRTRMGLDYDPVTGQLVLFGGVAGSYFDDTWSWGGTSWSQVDDAGDGGCTGSCSASPSARTSTALAFDPATGQLVLFGGGGSTADFNDTWDFDLVPLVLTAPSVAYATTLSGYDTSLTSAVTLEVANEGSSGFDLTVYANYNPTSGTNTLPAVKINGSSGSASSPTAPVATCVGTCLSPSGDSVTYPVSLPVSQSSAASIYTANAGSGIGDLDLATDWWAFVPAKAISGTYQCSVTVTLSYGP